ncbi:MAG: hypothetical protein QOE22_258 [Candidatus Parcubacteria bacterium]|jgi:hypothetical protein|nr:hypothetical protein [Candidatus Parcubacteria bacterium]
MRISPRNLRIAGASLIAVLMVAGGYVLPGFKFPKTKAVNAELTDDLLASYVTKDTDSDGLPDWQEVLYGTDANKADSDGDGIPDGEAVSRGLLTPTALASQIPTDPIGEEFSEDAAAPGSITDQFSRAFFQAYMEESGGQPMSQEAQQALLQRLLADFNARGASKLSSAYSAVSVRTDVSVSTAVYAKSVEDILGANVIRGTDASAILLTAQLILEDDASATGKLERVASAYSNIASSLLKTRVPPQLAQHHLELLRSFDTLGKSTKQIAAYKEDPLGVLGALAVFQPAAEQLDRGINGVATEILKSGEPLEGAPGDLIVSIARLEI